MANNNITIKVVGDISDVQSKMNQASDSVEKLGDKTEQTSKRGGGLKNAFKDVDMTAVQMAAGTVADLGNKTIEFGKKAIDAAGAAQAMNAQFDQVFGDMASSATQNLNQIAEETNILPNRLKPTFTQMAAFAKTTGMDTADALDLTTRATRAAADSAAFYDRSIDDVAESLQSYLKGNYENDAALGISSTETTRNAAANKLYGKSFKDLSEAQKQLTLLQMVEDGNKLSGALGQAAREGDGLENVTGNMNQAMQDFYATIGEDIFPTFIEIMTKAVDVIQNLAKWFSDLPEPVKQLVFILGGLLAAFAALLPVITAVATLFTSGLIAAIAPFLPIIAAVVAAIVGAIMVFLNWGDIVEWFKGLWEAFSSWIVDVWNRISDAASDIWGGIKDYFSGVWEGIKEAASNAWTAVVDYLTGVWESIKEIAVNTWTAITDWLANAWQGIVDVASSIWSGLVDIVKFAWELIKAVIDGAILFVQSIIQAGMNIIVGIMQTIWALIGDHVIAAWEFITNTIQTIWENIVNIATTIWTGLVDVFTTVWEAVKNAATIAWTAITDFLNQVWTGIKTNFTIIFNAVKDVIVNVWNAIYNTTMSIWNSIVSFFTPMANKIRETVINVWNAIKDFITNVWNTVKDFTTNTWNGIVRTLTNLWNTLKKTVVDTFNNIKTTVTNVWNNLKQSASNIWNGIKDTIVKLVNGAKDSAVRTFNNMKDTVTRGWEGLKSTASNIFDGIKRAIMAPIEAAADFIGRQVERIKSFFSGLHIQLPHIKLPHFSLTGSFSLKPPSVPRLSVDWYKTGGVFNQAQVIGVGEEPGVSEAVLPLKPSVLGMIGKMIVANMPSVNIPERTVPQGAVYNNVTVEVNGNIDSEQRVYQLADQVVKVISNKEEAKTRAWE